MTSLVRPTENARDWVTQRPWEDDFTQGVASDRSAATCAELPNRHSRDDGVEHVPRAGLKGLESQYHANIWFRNKQSIGRCRKHFVNISSVSQSIENPKNRENRSSSSWEEPQWRKLWEALGADHPRGEAQRARAE